MISIKIVADLSSGILWQAWRYGRYARVYVLRPAAEALAATMKIL
jgi:hypothetical protein